MDLLLDTNIVVPLINDELEQLPTLLQGIMLGSHDACFVSTASLWEAAIKHRSGKLRLAAEPAHWRALLAALGVEMLSIDPAHVLQDVEPPPATKDPFDRLLLAVCAFEAMRLVTTDAALRDHPLAYRPPLDPGAPPRP